MPRELAACVERANLDPEVHVIALAGNGTGFCGGYDLVASAEGHEVVRDGCGVGSGRRPDGLAARPAVQARNHDPSGTWDPVTDFQMMSRNVRGFMSLFHSEKPVVCKVHGYCVAGGTDMALCSDLLVVEDRAKIGYPPARVWGVPTTALWAYRIGPARAKRLLLTGDSIDGTTAVEWGLATEARPAARARRRLRGAARARSRGCRSTSSSCTSCWSTRRSTRRVCRRPRCWAPSSTASPATRPRASSSSARGRGAASRKPSASATSRSGTSAARPKARTLGCRGLRR